MYYQVSVFQKNPNEKEIILKRNGDETREMRLEKAKAFLFPGVNAQELYAVAVPCPITVNIRTVVDYERIIVGVKGLISAPDEEGIEFDSCREWVIKAETKEEAIQEGRLREEGFLDDGENIRDFEVYANEISVEELIEEKEESIKKQLLKRYIERRYDYDNLTIREYSQLCRQFDFKNKEIYLDMLEEEMRIRQIKNLLRRKISPADISLKDYNQAVRELYDAKSNSEMETILEKYGVK
jgi:hypothetical protein